MIHNVYFWLKKDLTAEQRATFESELIRLKEIPYLVQGFVGKPAPVELRPVMDQSWDYSTLFHFKNMEDHDHYQKTCELHRHFIEKCKTFWERVLVCDTSPIH